jgi:hypothetical protein
LPPHAAYPVKLSANRRYLVDQENAPFLLMGDSPQALTVNLSEADAEMFFADREAHGFNGAWVNLLCGTYTGGRPDASTYDGIIPFTTPGDVSTPNEPFFALDLRVSGQPLIQQRQVDFPGDTGLFCGKRLTGELADVLAGKVSGFVGTCS